MSQLFVDSIEPKTSGEVVSINRGKGQVLEVLSSICDGSTVEVLSGTYTFENVTTHMVSTSSYVDITGSKISYTPPSGTKRVRYNFHCQNAASGGSGGHVLLHHKFFIDGVEVTRARKTTGGYDYHYGQDEIHEWVIDCNAASNDADKGQFTSWTTAKELKWQFREYSSSYRGRLHDTYYWDGATGSHLSIPKLTIEAIG